MVGAAVEAMTSHLRDVGKPAAASTPPAVTPGGSTRSRARAIAQALDCRPGEVVFASGGTEADNLALKGIHWQRAAALGPGPGTGPSRPR